MKENIANSSPKSSSSSYKQMNDDDLIKLAHNGDNRAEEILIERYKSLVYFKSKSYFITSGDKKDIIQEGMIGLYKAIRDYKINRKSSFSSFASMCIIRQMISAIKAANRQKHQLLNSSASLNKPIHDEYDRTLMDVFQDDTINDPENLFISKQKFDTIKKEIKEMSTDLEFNVIREYLKGKSYKKIAETLDIHTKSVDNALQRFKKKLERFLEKNSISI